MSAPKPPLQTFSKSQLLRGVEREIAMRGAVYARRVAKGQMTEDAAESEIELMRTVRKAIERSVLTDEIWSSEGLVGYAPKGADEAPTKAKKNAQSGLSVFDPK
ncbi:MAG: hypothetical protein HRJ53_20875 [Acidobacteria bacterium Pan2503]|uniref:Uncharacterized protein n=1 Tax=Candidatus Acidiferrum panamense TaxID=2741543 RepID=A0A7V8NU14_9BACT|nr:hypothetical protein [Candidatus Acidoferrum panamensis]